MAVTTYPEILFDRGTKAVVEGSVVFLYCQVDSTAPTMRVTWNKNALPIQDVPLEHISIRIIDGNMFCTYLLVVNGFRLSDNGMYQCIAEDKGVMAMGTQTSLMCAYAKSQ